MQLTDRQSGIYVHDRQEREKGREVALHVESDIPTKMTARYNQSPLFRRRPGKGRLNLPRLNGAPRYGHADADIAVLLSSREKCGTTESARREAWALLLRWWRRRVATPAYKSADAAQSLLASSLLQLRWLLWFLLRPAIASQQGARCRPRDGAVERAQPRRTRTTLDLVTIAAVNAVLGGNVGLDPRSCWKQC